MFPNLALVVLAGGKSKRFGGRNKLFIKIGQERIIDIIFSRIVPEFQKVYIVVNNKTQTRYLIEHAEDIIKYAKIIEDQNATPDYSNIPAAMVGFHSAFNIISEKYAFVLSADMPFIQKEVIGFLVNILQKNFNSDAIVPRWGNGYLEPMLSIYNVKQVLPYIREHLKRGNYQLVAVLKALDSVKYVPIKKLKLHDENLKSLVNINNEDDLRAAKRFFGEKYN